MSLFLKGLIAGFSIAAPVGPIGLLCIRRSLAAGPWAGLVAGLGAATADATCGIVAGFGLTAVSTFLLSRHVWLGLFGGLLLCFVGLRVFLSQPAKSAAVLRDENSFSTYVSVMFLTLTNPVSIISFVAVFAGMGLGGLPNYWSASLLVAGVFVGSTLWWVILSHGVGYFRSQIDARRMHLINRVSGALIFGFGVVSLIACVRGLPI